MKFPPEFTAYFKHPTTRAAFVSEIHSAHLGDCTNCGGIGKLFVFVATAGPLNSPPNGVPGHFDGGKWWGGATYGALCPACRGSGHDDTYTEKPYTIPGELLSASMKRLAEAHR